MAANNGGPAFPQLNHNAGMSLRAWLAGRALPALLESMLLRRERAGYSEDAAIVEAARRSLDAADALIAELNKEQP